MRYEVTEFAFNLPDGWTCVEDANRFVSHGPNREELIATATRVEGHPEGHEVTELLDRLWSNALRSASNAAAHPELVVASPLAHAKNSVFPLAIVRAQTRDGAILFCVVAARAERSVLFVTFEASNDSAATRAFDSFLKSLRMV